MQGGRVGHDGKQIAFHHKALVRAALMAVPRTAGVVGTAVTITDRSCQVMTDERQILAKLRLHYDWSPDDEMFITTRHWPGRQQVVDRAGYAVDIATGEASQSEALTQ
jgi:hypothetical protein